MTFEPETLKSWLKAQNTLTRA